MSEKTTKLKDYLELIGIIFVGFSVLCYITGYLVIAVYQNIYRTVPISVLQPSYIVTGVWAISCLFLPALIFFSILIVLFIFINPIRKWIQELLPFLRVVEPSAHPVIQMYFRTYASVFLIMVLTILFSFAFIMRTSGLIFNQAWIMPIVSGFIFAASLVTIVSSISISFHRPNTRWFGITSAIFCAVILMLTFISHAVSFGRILYPTIPAQLGGGAPIPVKILIQNDVELKAYLRGKGVTFEQEIKDDKPQDSNVSNLLLLLFSTEKDYFFALPLDGIVEKPFSVSREQIKIVEFNANLSTGYVYK